MIRIILIIGITWALISVPAGIAIGGLLRRARHRAEAQARERM